MSLGSNLIFLISQPRAGSTLLQRMLGCHPNIHTVGEPWLMLPPAYATRNIGHKAEYDVEWACTGIQTFLESIPGGNADYVEGIRRMYSYLYTCALEESGKRFFLDKTPRYYFIIPDLQRFFPEAHFIILLRNPLSVLCSIIETWIGHNWSLLHIYKHDLIDAPQFLLDGSKLLGKRAVTVVYEDIVRDPQTYIRSICEHIGIDFFPNVVDYGSHNLPAWQIGDQSGVYQHRTPTSQSVDKWISQLDDPQIWRIVNDYLHLLGEDTVSRMGYQFVELNKVLSIRRPKSSRLFLTTSLSHLLEKSWEDRTKLDRYIMYARFTVQRNGALKTMFAGIRRIASRMRRIISGIRVVERRQ
jgi:hypothetical protein